MMHAELLARLLPPVAFDLGNSPVLTAELAADGAALDAAQAWADTIIAEADPRTTALLLADWERVYGLPEDCICQAGVVQSFAERRAALVAKAEMVGSQSAAFYIALAAALGYSITLSELTPFNTESNTEGHVTDESYLYIWQVNSALFNLRELTTEDGTEMATATWGTDLLECVINRYKPAHHFVIFSYR